MLVAVAVAAAASPSVAATHLRRHLQRWRQLALAARLAVRVAVAVPTTGVPRGMAVAVRMAVAVAVAAGLPAVVVAQHSHHQDVDTHTCSTPSSEHTALEPNGRPTLTAPHMPATAQQETELYGRQRRRSPMTAIMNITAACLRG